MEFRVWLRHGSTFLNPKRFSQPLLWISIIFCLGFALDIVAKYFNAHSRLEKLTSQGKALTLSHWKMRGFECPTFRSELSKCKQIAFETDPQNSHPSLEVQIPLSHELTQKIISQREKPTLLVFTHKLSDAEKKWLSYRTNDTNSEWPSQAQLVSLGSIECEAKFAGIETSDFDPKTEPEKLLCFAQNRFSPIEKLPISNELEYFIAIRSSTDIGPSRWPILLAENQYLNEVMSLDQLSQSAVVLWNLISLLMPIFVIAFRFVYRGQKALNSLSDYALWLTLYACCIVLVQQSSFIEPVMQTILCTVCIFFEGVILTMLVRYSYSVSAGESWKSSTTRAISIFFSLTFIAAFLMAKESPQAFLVKSHLWRDSLGAGLGLASIFVGFYARKRRQRELRLISQSDFHIANDDFGTTHYFMSLLCAIAPLCVFGTSNLRELVSPSGNILKWEDLFFLPSQTALMAFFIGTKTRTSVTYGQTMKVRLESLFTGVLGMQRALHPYEAVNIAVQTVRNACPAAEDSPFEFVENSRPSDEFHESQISLNDNALIIPLQATKTYRGILRFEDVNQENLTEEEEHFLALIASALANHLETQEANFTLAKMHQASQRFVPRDFLKLLNSESVADFNLGDHIETTMSILFADIRDFTRISEKMSPGQNFEFINSFLTQIGPIIRHHGGFIDKYIGDAIMALFPESPVHAARCAVDMQIALRSFNDKWFGLLQQEIKIGCGIHYGPMVLGIVGYAERLSGTVMSDAVNLASRLESLSKQFAVQIVVSEDVLQHMSMEENSEFNARMLDSVRVKGRNTPVTIFEIIVPNERREELLPAS